MDKVICNKRQSFRCNDSQYGHNILCAHSRPHTETGECTKKVVVCGAGIRAKCGPVKDG